MPGRGKAKPPPQSGKKSVLNSPMSGRFQGFSTGSHRPKVFDNPDSLEGRRQAAREKAYGPPED